MCDFSNAEITASLREEEDVKIIECSGRLIGSYNIGFKDYVKSIITDEAKVILDFTDITMIDSAGLGSIVLFYTATKRHRGKIHIPLWPGKMWI